MGETIVIYLKREKCQDAIDKSNNPEHVHKIAYVPSSGNGLVIRDLPFGFCAKLENEDFEALQLIRKQAGEAGLSGTLQIRRAAGGVGRPWPSTKMNIRSGALDTRNSGFKLLCEIDAEDEA